MPLSPLGTAVALLLAASAQFLLTTHRLDTESLSVEGLKKVLFTKARQTELVLERQSEAAAAAAPQPDVIRQDEVATPEVSKYDPSMRCFETIGPKSTTLTRGVELATSSWYKAKQKNGTHLYGYKVRFKNFSQNTVQMLTRHWVFVDALGEVFEMKGPGARGFTPILEPNEDWTYESGTRLATQNGSMRGTFQMEVLVDREGKAGPNFFSARVGRLALSKDGGEESVPCGTLGGSATVPNTSVWVTRRVIVGSSSTYRGKRKFMYDVQINNVRAEPIKVVGRRWYITPFAPFALAGPASGEMAPPIPSTAAAVEVDVGEGVGGSRELGMYEIAPGSAFRYQGEFTVPRRERSSKVLKNWSVEDVQMWLQQVMSPTRLASVQARAKGWSLIYEKEVGEEEEEERKDPAVMKRQRQEIFRVFREGAVDGPKLLLLSSDVAASKEKLKSLRPLTRLLPQITTTISMSARVRAALQDALLDLKRIPSARERDSAVAEGWLQVDLGGGDVIEVRIDRFALSQDGRPLQKYLFGGVA